MSNDPNEIARATLTKEQVKLQQEWYQILKDDGFEDCEYIDRKGEPKEWLKGNSKFSPIYEEQQSTDNAQLDYDATYGYFDSALVIYHRNDFDNEKDRNIWLRHAEGATLRQIGKEVGKSHPAILRVVKKYRKRNNLGDV